MGLVGARLHQRGEYLGLVIEKLLTCPLMLFLSLLHFHSQVQEISSKLLTSLQQHGTPSHTPSKRSGGGGGAGGAWDTATSGTGASGAGTTHALHHDVMHTPGALSVSGKLVLCEQHHRRINKTFSYCLRSFFM